MTRDELQRQIMNEVTLRVGPLPQRDYDALAMSIMVHVDAFNNGKTEYPMFRRIELMTDPS